MFKSTDLQATSLAALVTVAVLGGLGSLADQQYGRADQAWKEARLPAAFPSVQQVVIVGQSAVHQVVVTGRRG